METVTYNIKLNAFSCFRLTFVWGYLVACRMGPPIKCCGIQIIGLISLGHVKCSFLFGNNI